MSSAHLCGAVWQDEHVCQLPLDHDGEHVASVSETNGVIRWEDEPAVYDPKWDYDDTSDWK